jgi:DNA polymerase-3 subunit delta'
MTFRDLIGHGEIARRLAAAGGRGPAHAYLLHGPEGVGKRAVADAFAAFLLCAESGDDACGTCRQCTRTRAGTHPDLCLVTRDEDRRDIRIDQARALVRWLTLRPMMAARKVALIDGAHLLNEHGQNALLKTLEEPPGASVVLLVAVQPSQLLPTVRSRCQAIGLGPLSRSDLEGALRARGIADAEAVLLAAQAGGSLGRALALVGPEHAALRRRVLEVLGTLPDRSAHELSALAQEVGRTAPGPALEVALAWYRDLLAHAAGTPGLAGRNPDAEPALLAAAAHTTTDVVLRQLEQLCDTILALERNANRVLAIETMLLALRRLDRGASSLST